MSTVNVYHQTNATDPKYNEICISKNFDNVYLNYTDAREVVDKITYILNIYDKQPKATMITRYCMKYKKLNNIDIVAMLVESIRELYGYDLEKAIEVYEELFNDDGTIK